MLVQETCQLGVCGPLSSLDSIQLLCNVMLDGELKAGHQFWATSPAVRSRGGERWGKGWLMCTGDPSADASSKSYALSAISCAGESFETAADCNRVLGFDILKMGGNTKIQKMGVHTC